MRDGLQWVRQIPPWCAEPRHGPHRRCPLRIASWVSFSHFLHMPHSFLQFYMHAQDIYVRVNISNMEMCSSSDSPQIDVAMSLPFPSPWPLRRPSAALHGSSVHTTMWLKMVLLWVCDCAFYFWWPRKCSPQSWELLRRPQLGSPASY